MAGWDRIEIKKTEELPKHNWSYGFFHYPSDYKNWDGKTWIRNFNELMLRDLTLFTLGDVKDKKILDIGCGEGVYLDIIARMGGHVYGQDISSEDINRGLKNFQEKGFNVVMKLGNAAKILFDDNYFDGVIAADFFEHLTYEEKNKVAAEVYRVLKPGGIFTIKTPNLDYLKISLFLRKATAVLKFKSPFNMHVYHTHNNPDNIHCGLTTYRELEEIITNSMFHFPKITYVPLIRKKLPSRISKFLYGKKKFCEQIIITARKPLCLGFYP